jgi:hypothetical protein
VNDRLLTARDRLGFVLAPGILELIEALVDERVEARVTELAPANGGSEWLTLEQAAAHEGCSVDAVRMRAKRGRYGEPRHVGRRVYVSRAAVDGLDR